MVYFLFTGSGGAPPDGYICCGNEHAKKVRWMTEKVLYKARRGSKTRDAAAGAIYFYLYEKDTVAQYSPLQTRRGDSRRYAKLYAVADTEFL